MMIDTSPWSSCSCQSPGLPCFGHTISSTGPSVSPFWDFLYTSASQLQNNGVLALYIQQMFFSLDTGNVFSMHQYLPGLIIQVYFCYLDTTNIFLCTSTSLVSYIRCILVFQIHIFAIFAANVLLMHQYLGLIHQVYLCILDTKNVKICLNVL